MKTGFASAIAAMLLAAPAAHAANAGVEAPIRAMIDGFNKSDVKAVKSVHVAAPVIMDEVAPYVWTGPTAFDAWLTALTRSEAAEGKTEGKVWAGKPVAESVHGDTAYVVTPSTYSFKQKGHLWRETGSFTFVLVRQGPVWKVQAWTWTSPPAKLVK